MADLTAAEAKRWLRRARNLDREINALLQAREEARARAEGLTRPIDGDSIHATHDPHRRFDRLAELEEQLDSRVDALIAVKQEILTAIEQLEDTRHRTLLVAYYINGQTWEEIAVEMGYTFRRVTQLHVEALLKTLPIISHSPCDRI